MTDGFISKQDFQSLDFAQQESLFSLSCLSENQRWSENVEWTDSEWQEHVIEYGVELIDDVVDVRLPHLQRRLGVSKSEEIVENQLLDGDSFTIRFLAWFLENQLDEITCSTESENSISEPDVTIFQRETVKLKVEVKRIVNTGNMDEYVTGFTENSWHDCDPNRPSVLLLFFPILKTEEWRTRTLIQGYQGMAKQFEEWTDDHMHIRAIPAPLNSNRKFGPLDSVEKLVEGLKDQ